MGVRQRSGQRRTAQIGTRCIPTGIRPGKEGIREIGTGKKRENKKKGGVHQPERRDEGGKTPVGMVEGPEMDFQMWKELDGFLE